MKIRKATNLDHDLLFGLMMAFNAEESIENEPEKVKNAIVGSFKHPELVSSYIAYVDCEVIGYVNVAYTYSFEYLGIEAAIDEIFVIEQFRRFGFASQLLCMVQNEVVVAGAVVLSGDISDSKPWLRTFYERNGFSMSAYRPYYKKL